MTPDQDPTRVIPRHTGTGHIPAVYSNVDRDLCAACGNQFPPGQVCDRCRPPGALLGRRGPLWQVLAGWLTVALLAGVLALVLRFNLILWHVHLGGRWP